MLKITGPAVRRQQYTRVPMADEIGPVSAILRENYVDYRPLEGSEEERRTRAEIIARSFLGEIGSHGTTNGYVVWLARTYYS